MSVRARSFSVCSRAVFIAEALAIAAPPCEPYCASVRAGVGHRHRRRHAELVQPGLREHLVWRAAEACAPNEPASISAAFSFERACSSRFSISVLSSLTTSSPALTGWPVWMLQASRSAPRPGPTTTLESPRGHHAGELRRRRCAALATRAWVTCVGLRSVGAGSVAVHAVASSATERNRMDGDDSVMGGLRGDRVLRRLHQAGVKAISRRSADRDCPARRSGPCPSRRSGRRCARWTAGGRP